MRRNSIVVAALMICSALPVRPALSQQAEVSNAEILRTLRTLQTQVHTLQTQVHKLEANNSQLASDSNAIKAEEEPWWRLLGQRLTAAWPGELGEAAAAQGLGSLPVLKLCFREVAENPRIVVLEAAGAAVRVSLEEQDEPR